MWTMPSKAFLAHQPGGALAVEHPPLLLELRSHPRLAIRAVRRLVQLADLIDQQRLVPLGDGRALAALEPGVERRTRHLGRGTRVGDVEPLGLPGGHTAKTHHCGDSFTQKATVRLSRSRSIRSLALSASSSFIRARSSPVRLLPSR